jgi:hypothetical protein
MKSRADVIALLDELARLPAAPTPAIEDILTGCTALAHCDWINRYGPADEWVSIAARYATPVLSSLIRTLVTVERSLRWSGGSVAAPIWLFRAYQERPDGDADDLANWIFSHRGNDYLPFGRMSSARTVAEWHECEARKPVRRAAHEERHRLLAYAKAQRQQERKEKAELRRQQGLARKNAIETLVATFTAMAPVERLDMIARDTSVPLGALPGALIVSCLKAAPHLPAQARLALTRRIDRRQARHWKQLRQRLA